MAKQLEVVSESVAVPKGKNETVQDFHFRQTFQPFCSHPVLPRNSIEERGDFINRILMSQDKT